MKNVLVTGAAGFVGSSLAARLAREGINVIGVDSLTDYYPEYLKRANMEYATSYGANIEVSDLMDADVDKLLDGIDVIFHQAGQPGVRPSWGADFSKYLDANVLVTQRLLEAAARSTSLKSFVYASSSSVYGDAERYPTLEVDRPQPLSPYGVTKLAGEHLSVLYAKNFGVPTVNLRYFTVYGPRQRPDMAFTRFITRTLAEMPISIYGTGRQVRDFTYIDDVLDANIAAGGAAIQPGTIVNIAGGSNTSVSEVITLIEKLSGKRPLAEHLHAVPGDVHQTGGGVDAAIAMLDWRPKTKLEDGLLSQIEWLSTRVGLYRDIV